ncbi:isopentenyl-diphosphate delta-isomerase, partial [Atractiella rhizophila]
RVSLMSERLIMVTPDDVPTGSDSKVNGHLMSNILPPKSYLHRAFSAFIFRPSDGRLLLQKRADEKITFPSMWTNTCCSHPLWLDAEREEKGQMGVRRAVQRKLLHELGIPLETIKLDEMVYVTRIHYLAPSDGKWGEHEIDYVMFIVADVPLEPSPNE